MSDLAPVLTGLAVAAFELGAVYLLISLCAPPWPSAERPRRRM